MREKVRVKLKVDHALVLKPFGDLTYLITRDEVKIIHSVVVANYGEWKIGEGSDLTIREDKVKSYLIDKA